MLLSVVDGNSYMLIASKKGKVMICPEQEFRAMGRGASGVKGMELDGDDDAAIEMLCLPSEEENLLVVTEHGYGKRSSLKDYRATVHRGGKGVKAMQKALLPHQLIGARPADAQHGGHVHDREHQRQIVVVPVISIMHLFLLAPSV